MGDEAAAMRALMGFASFGRPRKRVRRSGGDSNLVDRTASSHGHEDVHHVVPGTSAQEADGDRRVASRVRVSEHGVVSFVHNQQTHQQTVQLEDDTTKYPGDEETQPTPRDARWALPPASMALLARVEATKARFERLEQEAFARARRHANPFESLGRHRFLNRSAMKMANLDFLFQWTRQAAAGSEREPFVFADVCGGPGGFSEYLLWRMTHETAEAVVRGDGVNQRPPLVVAGFGITLKGGAPWCDWKLRDPTNGGAFHICDGADGTGDLYKTANIHAFRDAVRGQYPAGAHLVVADGGFPDARDQSNQELLMARLVLAETLTMFEVLRAGGSFVCKTFELSSPLMLQLVWLLHNCFDEIAIVKPVTSRPASSERYIVALRLLADLPLASIRSELDRLVTALETSDPLTESLRLQLPFQDDWGECIAFVAQASDRHAVQQIKACEKILSIATAVSPRSRTDFFDLKINRDDYYQAWQL